MQRGMRGNPGAKNSQKGAKGYLFKVKYNSGDDVAVKINENRRMKICHIIRLCCLVGLTSVLAACVSTTPPLKDLSNAWPEAESVFESGYRGISEKYLEPLSVDQVALDGIRGFSTIDPALGAIRTTSSIELTYAGKPIYWAPAPALSDVGGWARLTSEMAMAARGYSHDMRAANAEKLYEAVFDGVLSKLDIFSRYAGAEDARQNRARRDGFGGIGIRFLHKDKIFRISRVTPETPAASAGLLAGDVITHIDGKPVSEMTARQMKSQVRGPTHSTVTLTVTRSGVQDALEYKLTRTHIVPTTVTEKHLGNILYLKISSFNQDTARSLSKMLEKATDPLTNKTTGIIIDIRGNPGGLLKQSVKAADLFLTQGHIISTRGRHADSQHIYEAGGRDLTGGLPILVLIDGKSASAAEIVAAALQDRERAVLVGTSSYGKGTVQTVLRLPNDGEITLTWSRLIAPSGYVLHGLGVRPALCTGAQPVAISKWLQLTIENKLDERTTFDQWRTPGLIDEERRHNLRNTCPAGRRLTDNELEVAKHLIENPASYMQALSISAATHQAHQTLK